MVQPDGFDRLLSTQKSRSGFQGYRLVRSEGGPWPLLGKRIVPINKQSLRPATYVNRTMALQDISGLIRSRCGSRSVGGLLPPVPRSSA